MDGRSKNARSTTRPFLAPRDRLDTGGEAVGPRVLELLVFGLVLQHEGPVLRVIDEVGER